MKKESQMDNEKWELCTSEGAEWDTLQIGKKMSLREKLEWLEEMETTFFNFKKRSDFFEKNHETSNLVKGS